MDNDIIKYIKDNVNIVDIIQYYAPRKIETNGFCLCVNHSEKTPSMKIYKGEGIAHCFGGCGFHGDSIDVVQTVLGISKTQAIARICNDFNLNYNFKNNFITKEEYFAKKQAERQEIINETKAQLKQEFIFKKSEEISINLLTLRKKCAILYTNAIFNQSQMDEYIKLQENIKQLEDIYLTLNGLSQDEPKTTRDELVKKLRLGVIKL